MGTEKTARTKCLALFKKIVEGGKKDGINHYKGDIFVENGKKSFWLASSQREQTVHRTEIGKHKDELH